MGSGKAFTLPRKIFNPYEVYEFFFIATREGVKGESSILVIVLELDIPPLTVILN